MTFKAGTYETVGVLAGAYKGKRSDREGPPCLCAERLPRALMKAAAS